MLSTQAFWIDHGQLVYGITEQESLINTLPWFGKTQRDCFTEHTKVFWNDVA